MKKKNHTMTLGEYLINARKERGYSQRDLAKMSCISPAEVSRVETGARQQPSPNILKAFADALAIDYETLMRLAGYLPQDDKTESRPSASLTSADGKLRPIAQCAEEMYAIDKEWLQIAYLVAMKLNPRDRETVRQMTEIQLRHMLGKTATAKTKK